MQKYAEKLSPACQQHLSDLQAMGLLSGQPALGDYVQHLSSRPAFQRAQAD